MPGCRCQFCAAPLEPVLEFRHLVESATADDPVHLARIRALPHAAGRPLRVCKGCQREMCIHPARFRLALERAGFRREVRAGVVVAGLLSLGWVVPSLIADV